MKRRVTIVYNPVQPVQQQNGRRTGQHGSRWDHSLSVQSPAAYSSNIIPSALASPSSPSTTSPTSEASGGNCCAGSVECIRHPARKGTAASVQCPAGPTVGNVTATSTEGATDRHDWCRFLVVGLIAALCYVNGIQGDFVHDDIPAITLNKDVLGLSPVAQVFRNDFWGTPMADLSSHKSYRPLTTLTFR
ncbi:hypothetical protein ZHAS_00003372 [Anopheles sinensis]|uniref:Uncharacterized protein n=1 Tax=Anopheles sinensis TaxID=74873 RepID=A0A084VE62_ANOSI|nr:hypothetical protein ZHAS_00003372 [Anopheles sinensis]